MVRHRLDPAASGVATLATLRAWCLQNGVLVLHDRLERHLAVVWIHGSNQSLQLVVVMHHGMTRIHGVLLVEMHHGTNLAEHRRGQLKPIGMAARVLKVMAVVATMRAAF